MKKNSKEPVLPEGLRLPPHIAIIMDGNGRWARRRAMPRFMGHRAGVESVRKVLRACAEIGVRYLTLYTFSTENWQRPRREVDQLMQMLGRLLVDEEPELQKNGVRVRAIGRVSDLPLPAREKLADLIEHTGRNTGVTLTLSLSYGGRSEIVDACRALLKAGIAPESVTEKTFPKYLYDAQLPDVDLLIRTAGEQRISNFLLWQAAYAEFVFTETLWPDFRKPHLVAAIEEYNRRVRKFGRVVEPEGTSEQA
jgi:undecaprenyl diphosphate synthase